MSTRKNRKARPHQRAAAHQPKRGYRGPGYQQPPAPRRGVRVEDIDGVTCLVRSALPLSDDDRAAIAEFATHLVSADVDEDTELPERNNGEPTFAPLDDAAVWLHPADPRIT